MDKKKKQYSFSLLASVVVHTLLLAFLLLSVQTSISPAHQAKPKGEIVQAVMMDDKHVTAEVNRLKTEEIQQKQMVQKLEETKKERAQEEAKLQKLKQDLIKAKQEEQNRLADIKLAKEKEKQKLAKLKEEREKEQKKITALDEERHAEQERVKQMRIEREKEEKKQAQLAKTQAKSQTEAKQQAEKQAALNAKKAAAAEQQVLSEVQKILGEWGEKIKLNKREAFGMAPELFCKLAISILPDGTIQVKLVQSSGNPIYDDLSIKAVYKSQPFVLPENPLVRDQVRQFELGLYNDDSTE